LFGNAPGLEVEAEAEVLAVDAEVMIELASAGLNIAMLATGLLTMIESLLVLAFLVFETRFGVKTMISSQEIKILL